MPLAAHWQAWVPPTAALRTAAGTPWRSNASCTACQDGPRLPHESPKTSTVTVDPLIGGGGGAEHFGQRAQACHVHFSCHVPACCPHQLAQLGGPGVGLGLGLGAPPCSQSLVTSGTVQFAASRSAMCFSAQAPHASGPWPAQPSLASRATQLAGAAGG